MGELVGRRAERAALAGVVASRGALVLRGEPGVGKSALLDDLAAGVAGVRVLRAAGVEGEAEVAYAALRELLRGCRGEIVAGPELAPLAAALGLRPAPAGLSVLRLEAALELLLGRLAPVLLVVDDAHWLDEESARLLASAARGAPGLGIAVVFAARPGGFTGAGLAELLVGPLGAAEARLLLERSAVAVSGEVAGRVFELAAGNPLALLELPRGLGGAQRGGLEPDAGGVAVTERLLAAFGGRLRGLSGAGRLAVLAAAVADPADAAALPGVLASLGLPGGALDEAEQEGLVRVGEVIRFRHPLVRQAALAGATAAERRRIQAGLGEASPDPERRLWYRAQAAVTADPALAGELEEQAERAHARIAFSAETRLAEQAARLTEDPPVRAQRLIRAAAAAVRAGMYERAERLLEDAAAADSEIGTTTAALTVRSRLLSVAGDYDALHAVAERAAQAAGAAPARDAVRALRIAAIERLVRAEPEAAVAHATAALERAGDEPVLRFLGHETLALCLLQAGRVAEARTHAQTALALADAGHGHPEHIGTLGNALSFCELYADGRRLLAAQVDWHRRAGNVKYLASSLENLSDLLRRTGDLRAAERAAAEALQVASSAERAMIPFAQATLAWARALLGEPDALALAEQAAGSAGELGNRAWAAAALAQARLLAGDPAGALAALAPIDAAEPAGYREPNQLRVAGIRLEALIALGRREQAGHALAALAAAAAGSSTHWTRATAARFTGVLAADDGQAERAFTAALAELDPRTAPLERAATELDRGRRLARAAHRKQARAALETAHAGFTAAGAAPLAETAARAIGATAPRLRPRQPGSGQHLTTRERQVAEHAAAGASDREIAAALYLSTRTIDFHLRNVFRKLGIRTRAELTSHLPR